MTSQLTLRLLFCLAASPLGLLAQAARPAQGSTPTTSIASVPPAAAASGKELSNKAVTVSGPSQRLSGNLSASISATLPKYTPPPPKPERKAEDEEDKHIPADGVEIDDPEAPVDPNNPDAPRNKIIRLPKQVVRGERPPVFTDREMHTKAGLAKLAKNRYLSSFDKDFLNRYTLPIIGMSAEQRALMLYEQDERLQNISDLKDDALNAARSGDRSDYDFIRKETNRAYMRQSDFGPLPKE